MKKIKEAYFEVWTKMDVKLKDKKINIGNRNDNAFLLIFLLGGGLILPKTEGRHNMM